MTDDALPAVAWDEGPGLLTALLRHAWLVALLVILGGAAGYAYSSSQPPLYAASARVLLADPSRSGVFDEISGGFVDSARYLRNQTEVMTSTPVLERAAQLAGVAETAEELRGRLVATPATDLDLLVVTAHDGSAEGAALLADAVVDAYESVVSENVIAKAEARIAELQETRAEIESRLDEIDAALVSDVDDAALVAERTALAQQLETVSNRSGQIDVDAALWGSGVELREDAVVPSSPVRPRPVRTAAAAALLAFAAASGLAWWRELRRSEDDPGARVERLLGAPVLAEVPEFRRAGVRGSLPAATDPDSGAAEAYQFLTTSIDAAMTGRDRWTLLVTSVRPGDGKTVTCCNLGVSASRDRRSVLIIDGDARAAGLTRATGVTGQGLAGVVADGDLLAETIVEWRPNDDTKLWVIPSGVADADRSAFLRSAALGGALQRVREHADVVIVDSPPLLAVADTTRLAEHVDGVVLVVSPHTPDRLLTEAARRLELVGTPLLGVVLNRTDPRESPYGYGYGYGYGAATDAGDAGRRRRRGARN